MTLSIGIIGCGAATQRYYLPALKKYTNAIDNLYFVDLNLEQAIKTKEEFGRGDAVDDYRKIINNVNGAIIIVPNQFHFPVAMEFIESGVNVLCEKPLAESSDEVRKMVEAAKKNGTSLCVNNTRRMFPSFIEAKRLLDQGYFGKINSIEYVEGSTFGWKSLTGFYVNPALTSKGIMMDLGPHVIDTICWLIGKKPKLIEYIDDSFGGPESVAKVKAEIDGCQISIFLNRLFDLDSYFKINGELGQAIGKPMAWNNLAINLNGRKKENRKLPCKYKSYPEFVCPVVKNFISVANRDASPLVSGVDVRNSIEFIDECYKNRKRFHMPWYDTLPKIKKEKINSFVLVTGASGFIGGSLVEAMCLRGQKNIKAGINSWGNAARIGRFPVDIIKMDLMKVDEIEKAIDGVTAVVHCAKGPEEVTVNGTRNLLRAALKRGVKRFVHMSTTEVYGNVEGVIDEDTPFQYTGNAYNKMKIDAEKVCWEFYEKGLPVTVLRPSIVYGPFSNSWTLHIAKMLIAGEWGIYEKIGEGKCNLVHIDDLIRAILISLENENAVGKAFNVVGPEVVTWNRYFEMFNKSLGLPPLRQIKMTEARLKTAAMMPVRLVGGIVRDHFMGPVKKMSETFEVIDRLLRGTEKKLKKTPVFDELKLFDKKATYSIDRAKNNLNYIPDVDLKKGLNYSAEWITQQRLNEKN